MATKKATKKSDAVKATTKAEETQATDAGGPPEIPEKRLDEARGVLVNLRPIEIGTVVLKVRGLSPLLVHAWGKKAIEEMLALQTMTAEEKKLAKKNREKKDPERDFKEAKYIRDGHDCFPSVAFKKAMVDAGYQVGIPRNIVRAALFIVGDFVRIKYSNCVMREDPVRVGPFGNRTADLRYRPEYQNWTAELEIRFRTDLMDATKVAALLQNAGFSIGVGEWRPQKDGQFGMFEVI